MNIKNTLNHELLQQAFVEDQDQASVLELGKSIASMYSFVENALAVLSDLRSNRSYIYYGKVADALGMSTKQLSEEIDSIWEEKILNHVHPDDLLNKHLMELQFFHFLRKKPIHERSDYYISSWIRMKHTSGKYVPVQHRMFYVGSQTNGSLWLALCLYNLNNPLLSSEVKDAIVNSATGELVELDKQKCNEILSDREIEVLRHIKQGMSSKEISQVLSISLNTVNRHRQNILEKLRVRNSLEACRIAECMGVV